MSEKAIHYQRLALFEVLADRFGCPEAKRLPVKEKVAVIRRLGTDISGHAFITQALRAMKTVNKAKHHQSEHVRWAQAKAAAKRLAKKDAAEILASLHKPISRLAGQAEHHGVLAGLPTDLFFRTKEWRALRWRALHLYGRRCMSCGAVPADEARLTAAHVESRIARPDRAFDIANLRILCADCQVGRLSCVGQEDA